MVRTISVHGSEGQFHPVPVTVPISPIHSNARLSLLGFFSIGTVPFPPGTLRRHPVSGVLIASLRYREFTNPLTVLGGGGVIASVAV